MVVQIREPEIIGTARSKKQAMELDSLFEFNVFRVGDEYKYKKIPKGGMKVKFFGEGGVELLPPQEVVEQREEPITQVELVSNEDEEQEEETEMGETRTPLGERTDILRRVSAPKERRKTFIPSLTPRLITASEWSAVREKYRGMFETGGADYKITDEGILYWAVSDDPCELIRQRILQTAVEGSSLAAEHAILSSAQEGLDRQLAELEPKKQMYLDELEYERKYRELEREGNIEELKKLVPPRRTRGPIFRDVQNVRHSIAETIQEFDPDRTNAVRITEITDQLKNDIEKNIATMLKSYADCVCAKEGKVIP